MRIHRDKRWCERVGEGENWVLGVSKKLGIALFVAHIAMIGRRSFAFSLFLPIFTPNCIYGAEAPNQ